MAARYIPLTGKASSISPSPSPNAANAEIVKAPAHAYEKLDAEHSRARLWSVGCSI
ncbi:hypothetical protein [Sphaerisporangium dianthi]|uniref:Uncharacterized protein n=1 Tax=Sphaerisporangium dianthi TaxID=1436120 RepID=A0ABV9CTV7_9ACTN